MMIEYAKSYRFLLHYDILEKGIDPAYEEPDLSQIYTDALNKNWYWLYSAGYEVTFAHASGMSTYLTDQKFFYNLVGEDPIFQFSWKEEYPSPVINILQQPAEANEVLLFADWVEKQNLLEVENWLESDEVRQNICSADISESNRKRIDSLSYYHKGKENQISTFLDETGFTLYKPSVISRNLSTCDPDNNGYLGRRFFSPNIDLDSNPYIKKKDLDAELRVVPYLVITTVHNRESR